VSRKNRKRTLPSHHGPTQRSWFRRHAFWLSLGLVAVAAITAISYFPRPADRHSPIPIVPSPTIPQPVAATVRKAETLDALLAMPPEQLADVDIAEMSLLCAAGLPGAEKLDIDHCLATLDRWAAKVRFETDRHRYRVTDPRYAEHYRHSEAYLRAEMLLQVLQVDLGVRYDMTAAHSFDFNDSRVAFIHGMIPAPGQTIAETPGGTCASMPVMYVAVGRRLGYPLKLVTTKGHIFVRWEGRDHPNPAWRERFNIEGAGDGFSSYDDEHYKMWPFKLTEAQVKANGWLVSLTPIEEFAEFLSSRGHCGTDNGRPLFAARCFENAYRYDTSRRCYRDWFLEAAAKSGYRPTTPALARLLARRMRPGGAGGFEQVIAEQQAAARREWMRRQEAGSPLPGMPSGIPVGGPFPPDSGTAQQPGAPNTHQPPIPGQAPK